jgi:hypothetical protein
MGGSYYYVHHVRRVAVRFREPVGARLTRVEKEERVRRDMGGELFPGGHRIGRVKLGDKAHEGIVVPGRSVLCKVVHGSERFDARLIDASVLDRPRARLQPDVRHRHVRDVQSLPLPRALATTPRGSHGYRSIPVGDSAMHGQRSEQLPRTPIT